MKLKYLKQTISLLGLSLLLFACSSTRHFDQSQIDTKALYGAEPTDTSNIGQKQWKEIFTDAQLQALIAEGIQNNLDIRTAQLNVEAAEAYFSQSKASFFPNLSLGIKSNSAHNPETLYPNSARNQQYFQWGAEASWELDIWGKMRSAKRAAYAELMYSKTGVQAIQTRLVANIAGAYYNLLALDEQLRISQESLQNNIRIAETMKLLKESGKVNGAAIAQSEAARYAVELSIPELQQKIREAENAMNFLLGRTTSIIPRSTLPKQSDVPWISVGVPSQLLENRPDVVQAQYDVIQAYEMVNNAKSYFFPALNLTASAGFAASDLSLLLDPTAFAANFVAGLTAPIFNKRGNTTRLKVSKVQREQSLIHLRGTLLTAGQEVNNALFAYQTAQQKKDLRSKQVQSLETAVSMTRELLNYGTANYTEVLTAQEKLLAAQLGVVNDRAQQLAAQVSLYRALGGGWK